MAVEPQADPSAREPAELPTPPKKDAVDADPRLGRFLSGWRIDTVIARESDQTVYAAVNRVGDKASLRVLDKRSGGRKRVFREVQIVRRLEFPTIPRVYAADVTAGGEPYVVYERLDGVSCERLIVDGISLPIYGILLVAHALWTTLQDAHAAGFIHRTLRPRAVHLGSDGLVRVLEWGLAWDHEDHEPQTFEALGVEPGPGVPPELAKGEKGSAASDAWLSARILAGLLLQRDIAALTSEELAEQLGDGPADVPELGEWLRTALRSDPRERPSSLAPAIEMAAQALARFEIDPIADGPLNIAQLVQERRAANPELDRAAKAWQSITVLRELFVLVEQTIYVARRNTWAHPATHAAVDNLTNALLEIVRGDDAGVALDIRPYSIEARGRPVWEPVEPFDMLPYNIFAAGFRQVRFLPGIDSDECRRFIRWLLTDPKTDLSEEDDMATVWWRNNFQHVSSDLVSSVVLSDLDEYDVLDKELVSLRSKVIDDVRRRMSQRLAAAAAGGDIDDTDADALLRAAAAAFVPPPPRIPPDVRASIAEVFVLNFVEEPVRTAEVVGRSWQDAVLHGDRDVVIRAFHEWVGECLRGENALQPLHVFAALRQHISPDDARLFAEPFQPPERMQTVLDAVIPDLSHLPPETRAAWEMNRDNLARLSLLLDVSGATPFAPVLRAMGRTMDDGTISLLSEYVGFHILSDLEAVTQVITEATEPAALAMLAALEATHDPAIIPVVAHAERSNADAVRLEALAVLVRMRSPESIPVFERFVNDSVSHTRRNAIRLMENSGLRPAWDVLERVARKFGFDEFPLADRHMVLHGLLVLDPPRGEAMLIDMLESESFLGNAQNANTRELVAALLGELGTAASLAPLKKQAGRFLLGNKAVKEAAQKAWARLQERLAAARS